MDPDFNQAKLYVFDRLARELSPHLTYHSLQHTRDDVLPAAARLGRIANLDEEDQLLLKTAALFHDTGFLLSYQDHEEHSIKVTREALPRFGYSAEQIDCICAIIAATKMPQRPHDFLQQLMCDADLDLLGRGDFMGLNHKLLDEVRYYSQSPVTEEQWFKDQARFLSDHQFFTAAARVAHAEGKGHNMALIKAALASSNGAGPGSSLLFG